MSVLRLYIALLLLLIASTATAADFRNATWGDSLQKVKKSEQRKPMHETSGELGYSDTVGGLKVNILYVFKQGRLVQGSYMSLERHTNSNDYIDDFENLAARIQKKYGEKTIDSIDWKNDLYRDDPEHWGMAVAMGYLTYFYGWDTGRTVICTSLDGDNFKIEHHVLYAEKSYFDSRRESQRNDTEGL